MRHHSLSFVAGLCGLSALAVALPQAAEAGAVAIAAPGKVGLSAPVEKVWYRGRGYYGRGYYGRGYYRPYGGYYRRGYYGGYYNPGAAIATGAALGMLGAAAASQSYYYSYPSYGYPAYGYPSYYPGYYPGW